MVETTWPIVEFPLKGDGVPARTRGHLCVRAICGQVTVAVELASTAPWCGTKAQRVFAAS
jgi:hypothetical protein